MSFILECLHLLFLCIIYVHESTQYYSFALPKARLEDQLFIQSFDPKVLMLEGFTEECQSKHIGQEIEKNILKTETEDEVDND